LLGQHERKLGQVHSGGATECFVAQLVSLPQNSAQDLGGKFGTQPEGDALAGGWFNAGGVDYPFQSTPAPRQRRGPLLILADLIVVMLELFYVKRAVLPGVAGDHQQDRGHDDGGQQRGRAAEPGRSEKFTRRRQL
jgi:hypothetical protein